MYDKNNIFAKILREEIPCKKIYENEDVLAFYDVSPAAAIHALIVPKVEAVSFDDFIRLYDAATVTRFFASVQLVAMELGVTQSGYRLLMNHGAHANQTVPHFHVHLLAGQPLKGF
jgi:histidine triad (HIT) family protein